MTEAEEREVLGEAIGFVETPEGLQGLADGSLPIPETVAEDYVVINFREWPIAGPYEGHEGYRAWARDTFEPIEGGHFEEREPPLRVGPGVWILQVTARGRLRETGMELEYPMQSVTVVRDGKLVRSHGFLDFDEAMAEAQAQVGEASSA
jgi:ketosteroid isomerase-like protein